MNNLAGKAINFFLINIPILSQLKKLIRKIVRFHYFRHSQLTSWALTEESFILNPAFILKDAQQTTRADVIFRFLMQHLECLTSYMLYYCGTLTANIFNEKSVQRRFYSFLGNHYGLFAAPRNRAHCYNHLAARNLPQINQSITNNKQPPDHHQSDKQPDIFYTTTNSQEEIVSTERILTSINQTNTTSDIYTNAAHSSQKRVCFQLFILTNLISVILFSK